jgi:hypothetical protein
VALQQRGTYWYGDGPEDVWGYFVQQTRNDTEPANHWKQAVCPCGGTAFRVNLDEEAGFAERVCTACQARHRMLDEGKQPPCGDPEVDEALRQAEEECDPEPCVCLCEQEEFEVVGVTSPFQAGADSAKWFYLGLRCVDCGCLGCYASWLERHNDYRALLAML